MLEEVAPAKPGAAQDVVLHGEIGQQHWLSKFTAWDVASAATQGVVVRIPASQVGAVLMADDCVS